MECRGNDQNEEHDEHEERNKNEALGGSLMNILNDLVRGQQRMGEMMGQLRQ